MMANTGYFIGVLEYGVTDVVSLRIWAIVGVSLVLGYQLSLPKLQMLTVNWCILYVSVNIYQLVQLKPEAIPELGWEEAGLHALFERYITEREFHALMELGEWIWLVDGARLTEQGCGEDERRLYFLTLGHCSVIVDDRSVAQLGPGSIVGEVGVLCDSDRNLGSSATVVAEGSVRCFAAPVAEVRELLVRQPNMRAPLESIFANALFQKALAMDEHTKIRNYKAVLEVACGLDSVDGVGEATANFRSRHGVSDELHDRLLDEVPQCADGPFRKVR